MAEVGLPPVQPAADPTDSDRCRLWSQRWAFCKTFYRPLHERYANELEFSWKLRHWSSDPQSLPPETKRQNRFRGRELWRKLIRMTADVMDSPRRVLAHPVDESAMDPSGMISAKRAEVAKFAVEHITTATPNFDTCLEKAVMGAIAARLGWMVAEYDPRIAQTSSTGGIVFRNVDGRRCFIAPGWFDVWDETLPYFIEQVPMRVIDVKERWPELADNIKPDFGGSDLDIAPYLVDEMGRTDPRGNLDPQVDKSDEGKCLVLVCWSRFDPTTEEQVVGSQPLAPENQYAFCPTCDYREPMPESPQEDNAEGGEAVEAPQEPQMPLCPQCLQSPGVASRMQVASEEQYTQQSPKYPNGCRLEIVLPRQNLVLEDRGWPCDMNGKPLRMPPYLKLVRLLHPTDFVGLSETTADAPLQTLSNSLMERARNQIQSVGTLIGTTGRPSDGKGGDFVLTDEPIQFVYFDDPSGPASVTVNAIDPVPYSLFTLWNSVQTVLRNDIGTFEMAAPTAEAMKGVQVGVTDIAQQTGSVPTNHFLKSVQRELGPFYGVICDWARICWDQQRWIRFQGPMGAMSYMALSGADIPNADFVMSADPATKQMDLEQTQAALNWYQLPPPLRKVLGPKMGVDQQVIDDIDSAEMQYQMKMAAMAAASGMTPQGPEAGAAGSPGKTHNGPEAGGPAGMGAPPNPAAMNGAAGMM